jgi:low temperature requirement protein LtrA
MSTEQSGPVRVSSIELFFDLVFVYTVTQLTHLLDHAHGAGDFLRALVVLVLIWWIYAGYAWLTNGVGAARRMRIVLIAAAAGFLVMSQAIPGSFGANTLAFGLAYLFVVALHLGAFALHGGAGVGKAIARLAPFNLGAAALVVLAAFAGDAWKLALFAAAAGLYILATVLRREEGFEVHAGHFVERHGLVIIIVLGESVVAIATGSAKRGLGPQTAAEIALSLVLIAMLWWCYFDRDDERAEHAMGVAGPKARGRMAIVGYWYAHLVMICGVVLVAAGVKHALAGEIAANGAAWLLSCGIAAYLAGDVLFRWALGLPPLVFRAFGAAAAPIFGVLGGVAGAATELAALSALVAGVLAVERSRAPA